MYGNVTTTGSIALAATGLAIGSQLLAVVGVISVVLGIYLLVKRDSKHRP